MCYLSLYCPVKSINQSNHFWSGLNPINWCNPIYPTLTAISPTPTLYLTQFKASSFSKPTLLLSFFTCIFHIIFGHPCFLLPFTSNSNSFLKTVTHHPSSTHAHTISLHWPLPSELLFPSVQNYKLLYTWLCEWLCPPQDWETKRGGMGI